ACTSPPTPMFSPAPRQPGEAASTAWRRSGRWHRADFVQSLGAAGSTVTLPLASKVADIRVDQSLATACRLAAMARGGSPPLAERAWLRRDRNCVSAPAGSGRAPAAV